MTFKVSGFSVTGTYGKLVEVELDLSPEKVADAIKESGDLSKFLSYVGEEEIVAALDNNAIKDAVVSHFNLELVE